MCKMEVQKSGGEIWLLRDNEMVMNSGDGEETGK